MSSVCCNRAQGLLLLSEAWISSVNVSQNAPREVTFCPIGLFTIAFLGLINEVANMETFTCSESFVIAI